MCLKPTLCTQKRGGFQFMRYGLGIFDSIEGTFGVKVVFDQTILDKMDPGFKAYVSAIDM